MRQTIRALQKRRTDFDNGAISEIDRLPSVGGAVPILELTRSFEGKRIETIEQSSCAFWWRNVRCRAAHISLHPTLDGTCQQRCFRRVVRWQVALGRGLAPLWKYCRHTGPASDIA